MVKKMIAMEIPTAGGPDVLQPVERALPQPDENEVLIKVEAAGVNRPDIMQRKGMYPPPPGASDIPGLEIAGKVVQAGNLVSRLTVGESVCALVTGGGYAEYCLASEQLCMPIPKGMDAVQGAALPETFFTVWSNVFERGKLAEGETLLVHGGASGIGTAAIQLARAFGSRVIVTAGTDDKCDFCLKLGAEAAIHYKKMDFVTEIERLTDAKGVDVILDMIGGDYFPRNLKCLAVEGRLVQIAIQHGPKTELNLLPLMLKRLTVTGSTLRARKIEFKAEIAEKLLHKVWPMLENGQINPVIHETFPLTEASKAHALMESSGHIGKIILTVDQ